MVINGRFSLQNYRGYVYIRAVFVKFDVDMDYSISQEALSFLEQYLNTPSPVGREVEGQKVWLNRTKSYADEILTDPYGSVACVLNPGTGYRVVLEAHCDEISWYVNYISSKGLIYVIRNGGSDHQIAPSKRVEIHTKNHKIVRGVFGWPAIHTRLKPGKAEVAPKLENITIDVGCRSKKEVDALGVQVGDVITYEDKFMVLNGHNYVCRALDNRAGGFAISEVARLIKETGLKLPYTLYVVNAVQEEVGLRGAEMMADRIKPHAALVTDVCHDTQTPMISKEIEGDVSMGDGPVVFHAPSIHNKFREMIESVATRSKIPFQRGACSRYTGTDTDAFAYSNGGVPSALVSLPLRYMHTTNEMICRDDLENLVKVLYSSLAELSGSSKDFDYFT